MDSTQKSDPQSDNETLFQFYTAGRLFALRHLDPEMNNAFVKYYAAHVAGQTYDLSIFERDAHGFFERNQLNWNLHDRFFTNFQYISQSHYIQGQYDAALSVWQYSLELALKWENQHQGKRLHKGTPFYWLGVISIQKGDLDTGFTYIHRAALEDKLTNQADYQTLPPFLLVSLDYENKRQAYHQWVQKNSDFLDGLLEVYRVDNSKNLTLSDFRTRFLKQPPSLETLFLFSYTLGRLYNLAQIGYNALVTQFGGQIELSLLFNLTIVIDETIDHKNPNPTAQGDREFNVHVGYLSRKANLELNQQKFQDIANSPFDMTLADLLNNLFALPNGKHLSGLEKDISVTYLIRNHGAHNASREQTLWNNFVKLRQSVFNMLFLAVEQLY